MLRHIRKLLVVVSLGLVWVAAGCAEQKKPGPVPEQPGAGAADRITQLQTEVSQCKGDLAACQDKMLALQAENDRLKDQLAKGSVSTEGGWSSVPGGAMLAIEGTVLFDSGKAQLKSGGSKILDGVAKTILSKYAGYDVYVVGHADNEPIKKSGWKDNYQLSCERSLSVLRHLRGQGVGRDMCACGWGEDRPTADNKSKATKQPNRRVEIFVMQKGK